MRLGPDLLGQVDQFGEDSSISGRSAAVRALIGLGLERAAQLDTAWRKIAWREGVVAASAAFKAAYQEAINTALKAGGVD